MQNQNNKLLEIEEIKEDEFSLAQRNSLIDLNQNASLL